MRRWQIIFLSMLFAMPIIGRAEGVDFYKGTVYQALDEARAQNKLVIVEFYAPWSHKSRWMHDNILLKSDLNQWFIVVSVDTESEDGAALAVQYAVTDYPVLLVCNAGGVVLDKIDRSLELVDFQARLSTVRLSTDKASVKLLQQIFTLSDSDDPATKAKVNKLVDKYISSHDLATITSQSMWDLFSTPTITYYGSAGYKFLVENSEKFFSRDLVKDRVVSILSDLVMPYIIGSLPFDEQVISTVESDLLSTVHFDQIGNLCKLARLRAQKDAVNYTLLLSDVLTMVGENYEYQLVMSLDFVPPILNRSDRTTRNISRRLLEKLMQKSPSPAKTELIESLLIKFL